MKKNRWGITNSTKLTMIFCSCVVVFSAVLLVFLMFFPLKMENPSNGINEKLIASAQTTTVAAASGVTIVNTSTTYVNTRLTTDKNRTHTTTTFYKTEYEYYDEDYYDYNGYNDYSYDYNYNNYDYEYAYTEEAPVYTQAPIQEPESDIPDISDIQ